MISPASRSKSGLQSLLLVALLCQLSSGFLPGISMPVQLSTTSRLVAEAKAEGYQPLFIQTQLYQTNRDSNEDEPEEEEEPPSFEESSYTINNEPVVIPQDTEPIRTIGGGADMIFEMARTMLLWDETEDILPTDATMSKSNNNNNNNNPPLTSELLQKYQNSKNAAPRKQRRKILPRWRPLEGVSDVNPKFRTQAPMMNSLGYSKTIWRNARKANKPSLWRHALRTYDRMDQNTATKATTNNNSGSPSSFVVDNGSNESKIQSKLKVQRTNAHHEGALVACAKLGLWQKAMQIYREVEHQQNQPSLTSSRKLCHVTDNMVLSVIRACVRGSRHPENKDKSLEERRAPLDACSELLLSMEEKHGLPLVARHLNPLAAAYQNLGLMPEAATLLNMNLEDRTSGPEEENGMDTFNVNDVRAKDKGSYSLMVKGSVSEGKWADAVDALRTMTEAGLYPNSKNLNAWTEMSERKTKQRATRSWKKKRDEFWLESVR